MKGPQGKSQMVTAVPTALRTGRIHSTGNWFRNRITFSSRMFKVMKYITKRAME